MSKSLKTLKTAQFKKIQNHFKIPKALTNYRQDKHSLASLTQQQCMHRITFIRLCNNSPGAQHVHMYTQCNLHTYNACIFIFMQPFGGGLHGVFAVTTSLLYNRVIHSLFSCQGYCRCDRRRRQQTDQIDGLDRSKNQQSLNLVR